MKSSCRWGLPPGPAAFVSISADLGSWLKEMYDKWIRLDYSELLYYCHVHMAVCVRFHTLHTDWHTTCLSKVVTWFVKLLSKRIDYSATEIHRGLWLAHIKSLFVSLGGHQLDRAFLCVSICDTCVWMSQIPKWMILVDFEELWDLVSWETLLSHSPHVE